jgi:hypothetical protein
MLHLLQIADATQVVDEFVELSEKFAALLPDFAFEAHHAVAMQLHHVVATLLQFHLADVSHLAVELHAVDFHFLIVFAGTEFHVTAMAEFLAVAATMVAILHAHQLVVVADAIQVAADLSSWQLQ